MMLFVDDLQSAPCAARPGRRAARSSSPLPFPPLQGREPWQRGAPQQAGPA
jgi:hypothetical protein